MVGRRQVTEIDDPTTTERRLLALAHEAALAHHFAAFDDYSTDAHLAHDHDFGACPHPDCTIVRNCAARGAPPPHLARPDGRVHAAGRARSHDH
jgi:hypothetical protein